MICGSFGYLDRRLHEEVAVAYLDTLPGLERGPATRFALVVEAAKLNKSAVVGVPEQRADKIVDLLMRDLARSASRARCVVFKHYSIDSPNNCRDLRKRSGCFCI
jgi:hypothetical protein